MPSVYRALVSLNNPCNCEKLAYLKLVKRGDIVVEVGANLGYFTRLFGNLVGAKGIVLAFEPIPQTREQLLRNVQDLNHVNVLPYAISDEVGRVDMFVPGNIHGQASLRRHLDSEWGAEKIVYSVTVECVPLAIISQIRQLNHIDFMKIDVEGAELQVLKGAREILVRDHPILHLEIEQRWMTSFGYKADEVESFLRSIGYTFFFAYDKDWVALDGLNGFAGNNVVCASKDFS